MPGILPVCPFVLLFVAVLGAWILQLFGISLEAFRIAGGILLFGIGMEMVYARTSRTKLTATEKYESRDIDDIAIMPLAIPMIAGPGAITTTIVLMNEAIVITPFAIGVVFASIMVSIVITYYMMRNSDYIMKVGQREYRAINRLMGMLLIAIAVQFVINGIKLHSPCWQVDNNGGLGSHIGRTGADRQQYYCCRHDHRRIAPGSPDFPCPVPAPDNRSTDCIKCSPDHLQHAAKPAPAVRRPCMQNSPVVRICSAQITSIWEDPEKTLEKAGIFVRHAAASGAALICFPEQFATGWDPRPQKNIQDINGSIVTTLQGYAKENGIGILGSFREANDPLPKNTAVAIGRDGRILATYAKMHLFSHGHEHEGISPGTELGMFTLGSLTCGIAICYDLRFPDLFRLYARKGVQAVFIPAAWPHIRIRHWELFIQARALENQMYIVGVNTTGQTPIESYSGGSMTADPHGTIISRANEAEQLLFCDLDPAVVETTRHPSR